MIAFNLLFVPPIFDISDSGEQKEEEDAMNFPSTTNPFASSSETSETSEKHNLTPWGDRPGDWRTGWRLDHSKGFNINMGGVVFLALQEYIYQHCLQKDRLNIHRRLAYLPLNGDLVCVYTETWITCTIFSVLNPEVRASSQG